jgi:hypothetical protein
MDNKKYIFMDRAGFGHDDEYVTNFDSKEEEEDLTLNKNMPPPSKNHQKTTTTVVSSSSPSFPLPASLSTTNSLPIDMKVEGFEDVIRIIKAYGTKLGFRTNLKHGTLVGGFLSVLMFCFLRYCSMKFFFLISLLPIAYGLFGSRTFALGEMEGQVSSTCPYSKIVTPRISHSSQICVCVYVCRALPHIFQDKTQYLYPIYICASRWCWSLEPPQVLVAVLPSMLQNRGQEK